MQKYSKKSKKYYRLFIILPVMAFTAFLFSSLFTQPTTHATTSSNLVVAGPYDTPVSSGDSWGVNSTNPIRDFLAVGQQYRIRQNGTVSRVYLYTRNLDGLTGFYVKIWRKSGTTYNLVGTSNNLVANFKSNSFNTVDLSTPITGVQEGDYIGFRIEGNQHNFYARSGVSGVTTYIAGSTTPSSTGYDWESQTAYTGYVMPINVYMEAPTMVFIGDSIIAGHPNHWNFLETTATTNIDSTIEKQLSNLTGYSYQNMGIGGQKSTEISARFNNDVIALKPKIVIIDGGVNDILKGGVTKEEFLNSWASMLSAAQADSNIETVMVLKMFPWSNGTTAQMRMRDNWNTSLATLASQYSKAIIVDASTYVGRFRVGGAVANLWEIRPEYNADGVHFNQAGHTSIAKSIFDRLPK